MKGVGSDCSVSNKGPKDRLILLLINGFAKRFFSVGSWRAPVFLPVESDGVSATRYHGPLYVWPT